MTIKDVLAYLDKYIAEHPEDTELEVKFGFYPGLNSEYEEPRLEIEKVTYLKIKIITGHFGTQIRHERKQMQASKQVVDMTKGQRR